MRRPSCSTSTRVTSSSSGVLYDREMIAYTTTKHAVIAMTRQMAGDYGRSGDDYLIVASNGGAPEPPGWYRNLSEQHEVDVQVLADRFKARARTAKPAEKPAMWQEMVGHWPPYDDYQRRTDREIPVVVIERV